MRVCLLNLLLFALSALGFSQAIQHNPITIEPTDVIKVVVTAPNVPYGGDYQVMADGAIYGLGFERLVVVGKTIGETQQMVRHALRSLVLDKYVFVTLEHHRPDLVYVLGPDSPGAIPYERPLTVRQVLGSLPSHPSSDPDAANPSNRETMQVDLIRGGKRVFRAPFGGLFRGTDSRSSEVLQPDDMLALVPEELVRVWITGNVRKPGEMFVPRGATVYEAIASAGGVIGSQAEPTALESQVKITLRRGPNERELPAQADLKSRPIVLEAGDVVTVRVPEVTHVTVMGEVLRPGDVVIRGEGDLLGAIGLAGGVNLQGTLHHVMLFRKGEMLNYDLSGPAGGDPVRHVPLESGDLVFVERNERAIIVLGEVRNPGRIVLADRKQYRLSDALALSGGLTGQGSLRHVYVSEPVNGGKPKVLEVNLDDYLRRGKQDQNPVLESGSAVLFTRPRGIDIAIAAEVVTSAALLLVYSRSVRF